MFICHQEGKTELALETARVWKGFIYWKKKMGKIDVDRSEGEPCVSGVLEMGIVLLRVLNSCSVVGSFPGAIR